MNLLENDAYLNYLRDLEEQRGLPVGLLPAVLHTESAGNPRAVSPKGAMGAFQFIAPTAKERGLKNPFDPVESADAAASLLSDHISKFGLARGLAAYNAGPGRATKKWPKETLGYVGKILNMIVPAAGAETTDSVSNAGSGIDHISAFDQVAAQKGGGAPTDPIAAFDQVAAQRSAPVQQSGASVQSTDPNPSKSEAPDLPPPAAAQSIIGSLGTGVKESLLGLARGIRQAGAGMEGGLFGDTEDAPQRLQAEEAASRAKVGQASAAHPIATGIGSILGNALPMLAAPEVGIPGSMALGAATGLAQPTVEGENPALNAALGAAGGGLGATVVKGAKLIARPVSQALSMPQQKVAKEAIQKGFELTPAMATGSKKAAMLESAIQSIPGSGANITELYARNQTKANQILARTFGEDAQEITGDVLENARVRIGDQFKQVVTGAQIPLDKKYVADIASLRSRYNSLIKGTRPASVKQTLDDLWEGAQQHLKGEDVAIPGEVYQQARSALGSRSAMGMLSPKDKTAALFEGDIQKALDGLAERGLDSSRISDWKEARRQWQNYLIAKDSTDWDATGNVQWGKLKKAVSKHKARDYFKGTTDDDLVFLSRFGDLAAKAPSSGTAERGILQKTLTNPIGTALGYGAAGSYLTGDPVSGLALGAGMSYGLPRAAASAVTSQNLSKYLLRPQTDDTALRELLRRLTPAFGAGMGLNL